MSPPPPRPGVTLFEMVLDVIVALTNRELVKNPLRSPEQHKKNKTTWDQKDNQRRAREAIAEKARFDAMAAVRFPTH